MDQRQFVAKATKQGTKTISEAVREGSLLDVTDLAKKEGLPYPSFISPTLAAKSEAQCPGMGLGRHLFEAACLIADATHSYYGILCSGETVTIFEDNDEYGEIVLILETGRAEEIGLKRTTVGEHVM